MPRDGTKLTNEQLAAAVTREGELFIEGGAAYLCGGDYPGEWPGHGHILPPLYSAQVRKLKGNEFVIVGQYIRDAIYIHETVPQAWWCRLAG